MKDIQFFVTGIVFMLLVVSIVMLYREVLTHNTLGIISWVWVGALNVYTLLLGISRISKWMC